MVDVEIVELLGIRVLGRNPGLATYSPYLTLGKQLSLSETLFLHLCNGEEDCEENRILYIKCSFQREQSVVAIITWIVPTYIWPVWP